MSITNGPNLGLMVNGLAGEAHHSQLMTLLRGLDGLIMPRVTGYLINTPPVSPADGDLQIVGAAPTGAYAGQGGKVSRWSSLMSAYEFYAPKRGWQVYSSTENAYLRHDGTSFVRSLDDGTMDRIYAAQAQAQPLLAKLTANQENASIAVLGDSTGNDANEWVYLLTQALGARFPAYTVKYSLWSDGTKSYPAPSTITTGSGANTLTVYNGSVAGMNTHYALGSNFAAIVRDLQPDLVFINYGHNQGTEVDRWAPEYLALTEGVNLDCGGAGIVCILQNPQTDNNYQALRRSAYMRLIQQLGYGAIDVYQAFIDYGTAWSTDLMTDTIHPNAAGSQLWVNEVLRALTFQRGSTIRSRQPSLLARAGAQVVKNGTFAAWSGALPDGWTLWNNTPTVAKDTTDYESINGYAMKITATGGVAGSVAYTLPLKAVKGRWVTAVVRIYVPASSASSVGRVSIADSVGSVTSTSTTYGQGAFRYLVIRRRIDAAATAARIIIYGDTGATNGTCTVDWVSVVIGDLPMGITS
jgi:lysophospholipase L1-like esterase